MPARGFAAAFPLLALALCAVPALAADDGVKLSIRQGFTPDEVRLDWTGGEPPFSIYRSTSPVGLVAPANKIGETSNRAWLDSPPAARVLYYAVTSPCVPATEICDGRDNDCDGEIDDQCAPGCTGPADCRLEEFCDLSSGLCLPDSPDGGTCTADDQCRSGHCGNGICCASGDCCAVSGDCSAYARPAVCESASSCQGTRADGICEATFQCAGQIVEDDSGCAGLVSQDCGPYPAVLCTAAAEQPADQVSLCARSCGSDLDCDAAAHCENSICVPDAGAGGACDAATDCQAGLFCADGVCCTTACGGTCMACDLPGSVGTCAAVPAGTDPDAECGSLSCAGYYWGWVGDTCYRRADVSAAAASCDGAGACRTTAQECSLSSAGAAYITCDSFCQDPTAGTCTGTTAGTCTNVNQGSATCGSGVCQVTSPRCVNGVPNTCVPNSGAATTEACNDIDDNCDSVVDNGAFADGFEPNNLCTGPRSLTSVGSNQTISYANMTLYGSGDVDYFTFTASETDSSCSCCDFFCTDEDYQTVISLGVPAGAGSYLFCTGRSCADIGSNCQSVLAGQTATWIWTLDGACPGNDSYGFYVSVSPGAFPGYECRPYTLQYRLTPGCF